MDIGSNPAAVIVGSFPTPNVVTDKLMHLLTPQENMVLQFMCRHILGFRDTRDSRKKRISLSVFTDGFTCIKEDDTVEYYFGTGLCSSAIRNALKALTLFRVIVKCLKADGTPDVDNSGQLWSLPLDDIDFDGLKARIESIMNKKSRQTAKALKARGVMSDITPDVSHKEGGNVPHKEGGYVGQQHTKQVKKQVKKDLAPDGAVGVIASPSKPKRERKKPEPVAQDETYHRLLRGVALRSWALDPDEPSVKAMLSKDDYGRIGAIVKWLRSVPVTPETLAEFYVWYKQLYPNASAPRDLNRFKEHFAGFTQSKIRPVALPSSPALVPVRERKRLDPSELPSSEAIAADKFGSAYR